MHDLNCIFITKNWLICTKNTHVVSFFITVHKFYWKILPFHYTRKNEIIIKTI